MVNNTTTSSLIKRIGTRVFNRVSKNSMVGTIRHKLKGYTSLFQREDNTITRVDYDTGMAILRDTQVGTGFDILRYLLSSRKWVLSNHYEDDEEAIMIYEFVLSMLKDMNTSIPKLVKQMVMALAWGIDVHEIIYDVKDGKIVVSDVCHIHIKTLQDEPFEYDERTGEVIAIHQTVDNEDVSIPIDKCFVYSYGGLYDEPEGRGLLYDFLPIIEDKENAMNWLMTFAERNGSPTLYGKTNDEISRDEMLNAFDEVADGTTGLTVKVDEEIGVLESSHNGEVFFDILAYKDNQIFRRMFIGNLLLGDTSQTGTYAQSQTQVEFGHMVFDGVLDEIASIIQEQLIDRVVEYNFGDTRKAPVFSFDKFSTGDLEKLFNVIKPLMDAGVLDSENSAVQESLALLFKSEAGVEYINTPPNMPVENFNYQQDNNNIVTEDILNDLKDIYG